MAGVARGAASLHQPLSLDSRSEQDAPMSRKSDSSASMDISGSLTSYTPRRNSFEPRLDFFRTVSLPVRSSMPRSSEPASQESSPALAQTVPIQKSSAYVSPIFSRGSPVVTSAQPADASSVDASQLDGPSDNVAHSAPIAIHAQRNASRDLAAVYDGLALTPSEEPNTANSSLVSGPLPESCASKDEEFSRRYREWHDVVYGSSF